jgi:hypothetical protein
VGEVDILLDTPFMEFDEALSDDLKGMLSRLGIPSVKLLPLGRLRRDSAPTVPGETFDSDSDFDFFYMSGGFLALSWRLRNDPEFRRAAMPKVERAIARFIEEIEEVGERDGGRLVKEVVPFQVSWPEVEQIEAR